MDIHQATANSKSVQLVLLKNLRVTRERFVLQLAYNPLVDANILMQAQVGNRNAIDFINSNRQLLCFGKATRYEFLQGGRQVELSQMAKDFELEFIDDVDYKAVIAEARRLRNAFSGTERKLRLMDSRQLATAKLKRVNFVTNDLLLLKRGSDLGISVHFVDLHSVGGIPSRAALKAAAYNPQPVTAR
ncbi:hypothetical protein IH992_01650 [Candidatus Poribacteria bacterium]|nr:hypothetical protein [Candidatus Poribacteria bacterium]